MAASDVTLGSSLAAAADELGIALSTEQTTKLLAYLALLQRWNGTYNLTSVRDPAQMLRLHLVDCLAIVRPLQSHLQGRTAIRLLDVGSGAGLPGVVIAVLCPDASVTCVDTVGKKAAFIRQVAVELGLHNLEVVHARVESMSVVDFQVITSRAFASLSDFVTLTRERLALGGVWVAMKGKRPVDELAALASDIDVFHVEPLTVPDMEAERCLVWMKLQA
jgi:16S rRNA (guanine527-N7)-methyltransferase